MGSSSPSADESAQKLLDNWCSTVNSFEASSLGLPAFDPGLFGAPFAGPGGAGNPLWNTPLMAPGFPGSMGLGLVTSNGQGDNAPAGVSFPSAELSAAGGGEGADYMYWDTIVQQIRGGVS